MVPLASAPLYLPSSLSPSTFKSTSYGTSFTRTLNVIEVSSAFGSTSGNDPLSPVSVPVSFPSWVFSSSTHCVSLPSVSVAVNRHLLSAAESTREHSNKRAIASVFIASNYTPLLIADSGGLGGHVAHWLAPLPASHPRLHRGEIRIHDRSQIQCDQLRKEQAANDAQPEGLPGFPASAVT